VEFIGELMPEEALTSFVLGLFDANRSSVTSQIRPRIIFNAKW